MCTRDGWMERLMDVLERRTHGETDRCTDGEQTPVPFPLAPGMPGVLSCGTVPVLSPEARPMVGCWPGPRRDSGTAVGLLTSLTEQPVSTKPPAAPGQVALPDPAGSALRLASSVAAPWHTKPGSKQPQNARQVVSRDGGEALSPPSEVLHPGSPSVPGHSPSARVGAVGFTCLLCRLGSPAVVLPCSHPHCARDPAQERKLQICSFSAAT